MSATLPGPNDHHAIRTRRQSSQSHTNLPGQINQGQLYSPNRSEILLPSTTYNSASQPRSRTSSISNNLSRIDTSISFSSNHSRVTNHSSSANPDEFYRQYPSEPDRTAPPSSGLHQDALRAFNTLEASQSRGGSNGSYSTNWSVDDPQDTALPPKIPGLKARKSSVKNLVAQINATSSTELPPVPGSVHNTSSTVSARDPNPFLASRVAHSSRTISNPTLYVSGRSSDSNHIDTDSSTMPETNQSRRPLFGEVLPTSNATLSAGYGIVNARRRTGSEGSPMHSPNPMFPPEQRDSQFVLSPTVYRTADPKLDHRRSKSEKAYDSGDAADLSSPGGFLNSSVSDRRPPPTSRIPVSTRRSSINSDVSSPAGRARAASSQDRSQPKEESKTATTTGYHTKSSLSVERAVPGRITSPGRSVQQGAKSPSLRANIIAPPPKISPPLRSSRPRMPVSAASTTSSRARMAEKFDTMQKINNQKRATQRRPSRPPELTDIDFVERRSRITRALTKSKESEELKAAFATGKKWQPTRGRTSSPPTSRGLQEGSASDGSQLENHMLLQQKSYDPDRDNRGQDRHKATRTALHIMQTSAPGANGESDVDSPTLGHDNQTTDPPGGMVIQTNLPTFRGNGEPYSAFTDATAESEATPIDPEPQNEDQIDRPSVLNSVLRMRERSPSASYEDNRVTADFSDRTDAESVNLIFRNTAYLDEEEAIRKGYRPNFTIQEPLPEQNEDQPSQRDSWTSSFADGTEQATDDQRDPFEQDTEEQDPEYHADDQSVMSNPQEQDESYRDTMASDAYTIINVVLQQHSSSGIVDQQFADDVYQKVLDTCPEVDDEGTYDSEQIEQLCLQEIVRRDEVERGQTIGEPTQNNAGQSTLSPVTYEDKMVESNDADANEMSVAPNRNLLTLPPSTYSGHRHKSSLDSAEDFATTSPSVGWMRFESDSPTPPNEHQSERPSNLQGISADPSIRSKHDDSLRGTNVQNESASVVRYDVDEVLEPEEYGTAIIRAPSRSPPPPPKDGLPSIDKVSRTHVDDNNDGLTLKPLVPHRITSLGQAALASPSISRPPSIRSRTDSARAEIAPWEVQEQTEEVVQPEARRLNKRKHIIKELVDTEFTYQRDMRVLCDIYKQTSAAALSEEDIKILFGNVEQVQKFARDFLSKLKQTSRSSLTDKSDRKKDKKDGVDNLMHKNSSSSTLASTKVETEMSDVQKDRETRIGDAFEESLAAMESVYTEYIRNRHAANQKLEVLQKSPGAQEWLKECRDNSSDITNAWNLDALLVKPVQRITKYPLLLRELIDATTEDHADLPTLKKVLTNVTDINMRINEVKKHAEMLDQVLNRKRGQSDVRTGLSKAFGRRAEKIRQHVGITDMYEDGEYDKLRIAYDNNYVQLMVVANDCLNYEKGITQWVTKMVDMAAAAEGWVDVGHTHHQQEESKLKHLAMIIRNVQIIALPDHLDHLQKKVIQPMTKTVDTLQRFKDEPKGLLQKRDKRLVDYAQMKNRKDRGEKIDKKTAERMDQWEALNTEAKERMRKLLRATAHLVQSCQGHLVQLQMSWMAMIQQKYSNIMGINLNKLSIEEIEKDWQVDFDYQEASALALGICNGSLVLQAANMTSFLTPGSTLIGEDSPRQLSLSSTNKRSVSLNSETSNVPSLDFGSRPSGTYATAALPESHFDRPYPYPNGRTRAASTTSGKSLRGVDGTSRPSITANKHTSASANFARPGTSPALSQDAFAPPRLSLETHSPLVAAFPQHQLERPGSSSTFFSATAGPSQPPPPHRARGSGVFTSALPMPDSPVLERQTTETPQTPSSEPRVLFTAASLYEFNIDRALREAGFPYLTYVSGEIFDVLGERGELWLAKNQDDPQEQIGWIWNKHFAKLAE